MISEHTSRLFSNGDTVDALEIVEDLEAAAEAKFKQSDNHRHSLKRGTQARCICRSKGECRAKKRAASNQANALLRKANEYRRRIEAASD